MKIEFHGGPFNCLILEIGANELTDTIVVGETDEDGVICRSIYELERATMRAYFLINEWADEDEEHNEESI